MRALCRDYSIKKHFNGELALQFPEMPTLPPALANKRLIGISRNANIAKPES
jgi:hypothetical protein